MQFTFPAGATSTLAPGAHLVLVENAAAFALRYGGSATVAGQSTGNLDNDGDTLVLRAANGIEIARISYNSSPSPACAKRSTSPSSSSNPPTAPSGPRAVRRSK